MRNGEISYWHHALGGPPPRRDPLHGGASADVCIVGAGFTGLWTAYYLQQLRPGLNIRLVEAQFAGFGASGRNGGWLSDALPGSRERYARVAGWQAVVDLQRQLADQVDEVVGVCREHGIEADAVKGGCLRVACTPAQETRLRAAYDLDLQWQQPDVTWLGEAQVRDRVVVRDATAGLYTPHCARIQPAALVTGLARLVESRGATIYESTPATRIAPGRVETTGGTVTAPVVLRATEGFTAGLPGLRRRWLPMNSSMIVTEPLPDSVWDRIGWQGCETLGDNAHMYVYLQRTADGRIAIGGRGVPYRFGSRTDHAGETATATVAELSSMLHRMFPATASTRIAHAWSGVLGVPRDWCATVQFDVSTGLGCAGGYVGHGVTAASLAGRTLADLVEDVSSPRIALPWVGHRIRSWEPEPLRWTGVRSLYQLYRLADRSEGHGGPRTSLVARVGDRVSGKP